MASITDLNDKVALNIDDQAFEFPVHTGSYNEKGIDISKLRGQTKYVTLDPGFKNTGSTTSAITYIDGANGVLLHRGYPIEQLADQADYPEVIWMLLNGELPNQGQLTEFENNLKRFSGLPETVKHILNALPDTMHPMGMLGTVLSGLGGITGDDLNTWANEEVKWNTIYRLLANMPVITAYIYRRINKLDYIDPDPSLGYVANFMNMTFGKHDPVTTEAIDTLLILHADHEQNCSAATVRLVGSSHVNLYAAIAAGTAALWGPLHGGANQAVLEMLESIQNDGGDSQKYIDKAKDKNDPFRLMGFGHRVYKNYDPRAKVIKKYADKILHELNIQDPILELAASLEQKAIADDYFAQRKLFPNVDFYSGIIYRALGIPVEMFTVMFALGRAAGWTAQWKEMREQGQPIGRPRQIYTGATSRDYIPVNERT